ncbi:MAG: class I SAM-dependent methyltransferase [Ignavibacteria bacterium]
MSDYDKIAKFYDTVIGRSKEEIEFVKNRIHKYHAGANSVLEIGCGTASNLLVLSKKYDVTGIDISQEMLKLAKKKIPEGKFHLSDIKNFNLKKKFDVILCLYDTINHLTLLSDWKKVFKNAYQHLNTNGLFIFDINTIYKLRSVSEISPLVHKFRSNYLIMDIRKISASTFNWNLKVFEKLNSNNKYELFESNIKESSFEISKISLELSKFFSLLKAEDETGSKVKADSQRVYFICKKTDSK